MKREKAVNSNKTKGKWITIIISSIVTLVVIGLVAYLIFGGSAKPEFKLENKVLSISGMYAEKINLSGAVIELKDTPLNITKRTNGYSSGGVLKGSFTVTGIDGNVYLNMYDTESPYTYISIASGGKHYFINCAEDADTKSLYDRIVEHMAQ